MIKNVGQELVSEYDDDSDNTLLEPAFGIVECGNDVTDLNVPPATGNEYLRRVREEAIHCPKVVVADLDPSVYKNRQTVKAQPKALMVAPRGFSPKAEWVRAQISNFATVRQLTILNVLGYHVNWLEATGFTHLQGQWFYALLASLQKPLSPEFCALLRQLSRVCSILRAMLNSPDDAILMELNLMICLVANYFDQTDLADRT